MKRGDVRIGNIVRFSNINDAVIIPSMTGTVLEITDAGLVFNMHEKRYQGEDIICPLKHCVGIQITPDALNACGFEYNRHSDRYCYLCGKGTTANGLFIDFDLETYSVSIGQLEHFSHNFGEVFTPIAKPVFCPYSNRIRNRHQLTAE